MIVAYVRKFAFWKFWTTRLAARSAGRKIPGNFTPRIDWLEDRQVPSTFTWHNDGTDIKWNNPQNWFNDSGQHQGVPGRLDTANIASATVEIDGDAVNTLHLNAATLTGSGTLEVVSVLTWNGGTMVGGGTTTIDAQATATINAPVALLQWSFINAGRVNWTSADSIAVGDSTINNQAGATFDAQADGAMSSAGGPWTFLNAGLFRKSGGSSSGQTLIDSGSIFTNQGTVQIDVGTLNLAGIFTNFSSDMATLTGGTYLIKGIFQFNDANIVTNAATIVLDGPIAEIIDQYGNNSLTYFAVNAAEGSFTLKNGAVFGTIGDFDNAGIVLINDVSQFYVNGNYTQESGTTTLTGSYMFAYFVDIQAGQLIGWGTLDSTVQSEGEVDVGGLKNPDPATSTVGTLTITGDYTQSPDAILQLKLGGSQTALYDHLVVHGLATLDGTLRVVRVNGFQPAFFDIFQIFNYGMRSGDFATTIPPDGYMFTGYMYNDDQGYLDIVLDLAP